MQSAGKQSIAGSDPSELRHERNDLHDTGGIFDDAASATRSLARLPPPGRVRPRVPPKPRIGYGRHVTVSDQALRVKLRSKRRTSPTTLTLSAANLETLAPNYASRQLASLRTRDDDRLLRLRSTWRIAPSTTRRLGTTTLMGRPQALALAPAAVPHRA